MCGASSKWLTVPFFAVSKTLDWVGNIVVVPMKSKSNNTLSKRQIFSKLISNGTHTQASTPSALHSDTWAGNRQWTSNNQWVQCKYACARFRFVLPKLERGLSQSSKNHCCWSSQMRQYPILFFIKRNIYASILVTAISKTKGISVEWL